MTTPSHKHTPPIITHATSLYRVAIAVIVVCIGLFLLWAMVVDLASGVLASGQVTVNTHKKPIQHLYGGIVDTILVKDGDHVQAGQVLIQLNTTEASALLTRVQDSLSLARASYARLLAEQQNKDAITFPETLVASPENTKINTLIATQNDFFHTRREALHGQLALLNNDVASYKQQLAGYAKSRKAKLRQITLRSEDIANRQTLLDDGLISHTDLLDIEREIEELNSDVGELDANIATARRSLDAIPTQKSQLIKEFQESVSRDIETRHAEINDLEEQLRAQQHIVDRTEITSPVDGVVIGLDVHAVMEVIQPGNVLMEIVPADDALIIEARIEPQDIDDVSPALDAGVKFSAFNQRDVPEVVGTVAYVSADSEVDQQTGLPFYTTHITIAPEALENIGNHIIKPGMITDIVIRTGSRKPIDYLLDPLLSSFRKAWLEG